MDKIGIGRLITVSLVIGMCAFLGGFFYGKSTGRKEMVVEAVKQNHGHYKIVDEQGGTMFEWGPAPAGAPAIPK